MHFLRTCSNMHRSNMQKACVLCAQAGRFRRHVLKPAHMVLVTEERMLVTEEPLPRINRYVADLAGTEADEPFWREPSTAALVIRLKEEAVVAMERAKTREEKDRLIAYYSRESMKMRVKLMANAEVVAALDLIWQAADQDDSGVLNRKEYMTLHRKLTLALDPSTLPQQAGNTAREDWIKDTEGKPRGGLDRDRFIRSWFEVRRSSCLGPARHHRPVFPARHTGSDGGHASSIPAARAAGRSVDRLSRAGSVRHLS